jgi:hypothetical protein
VGSLLSARLRAEAAAISLAFVHAILKEEDAGSQLHNKIATVRVAAIVWNFQHILMRALVFCRCWFIDVHGGGVAVDGLLVAHLENVCGMREMSS